MSNRIRVIEKELPTDSWGIVTPKAQTHIAGFEIGGGRVAFHPEESDLSRKTLWPLMMASFGINNHKIASALHLGEQTVKTHIRRGLTTLEIPRNRSGIVRHFFDLGIYELEETGESLGLDPTELEIVEHISRGLTSKEVADKQNPIDSQIPTEDTVKSHLMRISTRNDFHCREEIIFASIVSGELGDYALRNTIEGVEPRAELSSLQV